jgi:hypothetical protein
MTGWLNIKTNEEEQRCGMLENTQMIVRQTERERQRRLLRGGRLIIRARTERVETCV